MTKTFQVKILDGRKPSLPAIENCAKLALNCIRETFAVEPANKSTMLWNVFYAWKNIVRVDCNIAACSMLRLQALMIINIAYLDMAFAKSSEFFDFFSMALPSVSTPNVSLREQCIVLRTKWHSCGTSSSTWKHKYDVFIFFSLSCFQDHPVTVLKIWYSLDFVKCQNHPASSCWERFQSTLNSLR